MKGERLFMFILNKHITHVIVFQTWWTDDRDFHGPKYHVVVLPVNHVSVFCIELYINDGSYIKYTYMIDRKHSYVVLSDHVSISLDWFRLQGICEWRVNVCLVSKYVRNMNLLFESFLRLRACLDWLFSRKKYLFF